MVMLEMNLRLTCDSLILSLALRYNESQGDILGQEHQDCSTYQYVVFSESGLS
jgi:hypothetical protein